jgi:hypothetical protein
MSSEVTKSSSRLWRATGRTLTGLTPALESVLAGVVGLLVGALLMWIWGYDPWKAPGCSISARRGRSTWEPSRR